MDRYGISMPLMMMMMMMCFTVNTTNAEGPLQNFPACSEQLSPCINYMNSTSNPPEICCNPIKSLEAIQKGCLCDLALTPGVFESLGTNITEAIQLLHLCGVNFNVTNCKASSLAPPPSVVPPPAIPGDDDEGGADKVTFSGLFFVLFLWASMLF